MWLTLGSKGKKTSPAKCPLVECGQSDGATGTLYRKDRVSQSVADVSGGLTQVNVVTISDRTLVSVGPVRPVGSSSERVVSVHDRTLAQEMTRRSGPESGQYDI